MEKRNRTMTIKVSDGEKELIDLLMTFNPGYTQATLLLEGIYEQAYNIIKIPSEENLEASELIRLIIEQKEQQVISIIGEENYRKLKELSPGEFTRQTGIPVEVREADDIE